MQPTETINKNGFILEMNGHVVVSIANGPQKVNLGEVVQSNGRYLPWGMAGTIIAIRIPYENGRTSDVIDVQFKNSVVSMKLWDLDSV